MLNIIHLAK